MNRSSSSTLPGAVRTVALLVAGLLVAAGCLGGPAPTTPPAPTSDTDTATGTDSGSVTDYVVHVFDHAGTGRPVVDGGITSPVDGEYTTRYYVTTVETAEGVARFDLPGLPTAAEQFVRNTTFENETLVVIQAFPASSHPDYRVESVRQVGGTLRVAVNDSSRGATADITVETVLLRVPGASPDHVVVTTEDGVTFESGAGVVTPAPTPTATPERPFAPVNDSARLADGGDLRIENRDTATLGYNVTLSYRYEPPCRDETPACGAPARWLAVGGAVGKLPVDGNRTLADRAAYRGVYTVRVAVEVPADDGGRRTVTDTFEWRVTDPGAVGVVRLTDEGGSFRTTG